MSNRRRFLIAATSSAASLLAGAAATSAAETPATREAPPDHDMSAMPASWMGTDKIAMLLYPGFTALDLVGPQYFFANLMGATVHLVAKTHAPVTSDTGLSIVPTATLDECPSQLDVLFVPGSGGGVLDAMEDPALVAFVADRGARAKWVTSVCTGSLLLARAGLLTGYRATGHWVARDVLRDFGAIPVDERVVRDRNRVTGAGVSAGLDLGLTMVAELRDRSYAEGVQLLAEYAPKPPFDAGTPATAPQAVVDMIGGMFPGFIARARRIARDTQPTKGE
ncbi:MAG: DJ-1/PfpI family protein [Lysobacter sp.]|nr:MAG: DJ-1/PfpI family protein [Lysobacter sp.]